MKIWHVGASSDPYRVDGVSRTVWLLSRHQARIGHDISIIIDTPPEPSAIEMASAAGMKLIHVEATYLTYPQEIRKIIERERPDIVHMHSVFVVRQALLGRVLNQVRIPYVITPHGGLAPQVLRRGVIKKTIYTWLRERTRFMDAAAIALVTPAEARAVRSFIPNYHKPIRWMPNPVDPELFDTQWHGAGGKRVVFLGRFDVLVKGIDILVEIARRLPEMQVDLYGTEDPKTREWLDRLKQDLPPNLAFRDPIFGAEKARMLSDASLYIQPSRWEGFPVSVAECLSIGVPCAIADTLDLAQLFYQHNLGLVIPLDPPRAAAQIRAAMQDTERMREWSQRGLEFATSHFHPDAVAHHHVELYREMVDRSVSAQAPDAANGQARGGLLSAHMRGAIKRGVSRMVERGNQMFPSRRPGRCVVLCYHSINRSAADLSIDPEVLREQLITLREMGYGFMQFGQLVQRLLRQGPPEYNVACITFDDGFEDNLTQAAPILLEQRVPATIFVTSGLMQQDSQIIQSFHRLTNYESTYLAPLQVAELRRLGFEIGAHTHTHTNLARLSYDQAREQITQSKALIEDAIGDAVRCFAYPFGKRNIHYTDETVRIVRESGYMGAAAVAFRSATGRNAIRVFELPRFFINRSDSSDSFRRKVQGDYDWLGTIQEGTPRWLKAMISPEDGSR